MSLESPDFLTNPDMNFNDWFPAAIEKAKTTERSEQVATDLQGDIREYYEQIQNHTKTQGKQPNRRISLFFTTDDIKEDNSNEKNDNSNENEGNSELERAHLNAFVGNDGSDKYHFQKRLAPSWVCNCQFTWFCFGLFFITFEII